MYYLLADRERMLELVPKGGIIAEVGVAEGRFARAILDVVQPAQLHLIDPWIHQEGANYLLDVRPVPPERHGENFQAVQATFRDEIASGRVIVHRAKSHEIVGQFPDHHFDLVYIDAMHGYEAVLQDLVGFRPKVKANGLLAGHDYCEHNLAAKMEFGVVGAVNSFCKRFGHQLVALTVDLFSSYVLAPQGPCAYRDAFLKNLMESKFMVIEIDDHLLGNYSHKLYVRADKSLRWLPSF